MKGFFYVVIAAILLLAACRRKETALQKLCDQIRLAPQTPFPAGKDLKWKLIKEMETLQDEAVPDSLKSIFTSIDTTIRGYNEYYSQILHLLTRPDSRKSLKILSEIFVENNISDPSCSQVLIDMVMMDQQVQLGMFKAYMTKKDEIDYGNALQHIDIMFPNLTHILGKRRFTDGPVLDLMKLGIKQGRLTRDNLAASRQDLINYYYYLKQIKDNPGRETGGFRYDGYYESHIGDLVQVLRVFEPDAELGTIFAEALT